MRATRVARDRVFAALAIGAFLAGAGVAVAAATSQGDVPPEKARAMQAARTVDPSAVDAGASYREPSGDAGDPGAVAQVKRAVVDLLTDDVATGALPASEAERRSTITDPASKSRRATAKAKVWVSRAAAQQAEDLERGLSLVANDSSYAPFQQNRFIAVTWQGVAITGTSATATVLGHQSYLKQGTGWQDDRQEQWQIELVREGERSDSYGGWRLAAKAAVTPPGGDQG